MTRKHYEAFAARIAADIDETRRRYPPADPQRIADTRAVLYAAQTFSTVASQDNPRFDRDRFMAACGLADISRL